MIRVGIYATQNSPGKIIVKAFIFWCVAAQKAVVKAHAVCFFQGLYRDDPTPGANLLHKLRRQGQAFTWLNIDSNFQISSYLIHSVTCKTEAAEVAQTTKRLLLDSHPLISFHIRLRQLAFAMGQNDFNIGTGLLPQAEVGNRRLSRRVAITCGHFARA